MYRGVDLDFYDKNLLDRMTLSGTHCIYMHVRVCLYGKVCNYHIYVQLDTALYVNVTAHGLINEPQLSWLQTAIHHMGLDVKSGVYVMCFISSAWVTGSVCITCHAHITPIAGFKNIF